MGGASSKRGCELFQRATRRINLGAATLAAWDGEVTEAGECAIGERQCIARHRIFVNCSSKKSQRCCAQGRTLQTTHSPASVTSPSQQLTLLRAGPGVANDALRALRDLSTHRSLRFQSALRMNRRVDVLAVLAEGHLRGFAVDHREDQSHFGVEADAEGVVAERDELRR